MKIMKMLALSALIAVAAGALTGCYVETGRWHRPHYVVIR